MFVLNGWNTLHEHFQLTSEQRFPKRVNPKQSPTSLPSGDCQQNPVHHPRSRQRNSAVLAKKISSSPRVMSPNESSTNQGLSFPKGLPWRTEAFLDLDRPLNRDNDGKLRINSEREII